MSVMARNVEIDHDAGVLTIDGIDFPWHVGAAPEVTTPDGIINVVTIDILVDGAVTVYPRAGRPKVYDQNLGDVAEFARTLVRKGFAEAFPWLQIEVTE